MEKRKLNRITAGFIVLVVVVLILMFSNSLRRSSHITLPEEGSSPGQAEDTNASGGDALTVIAVTPETVQTAIETLTRPRQYSRVIRVEQLWDGGSGSFETTVTVSGRWTRTDRSLSDGQVRHTITDGEITYIWYGSESSVYSAPAGDITPDDEQAIPTYETILDLPVEDIAAADYRSVSDVNCIYVETVQDPEGYTQRYWVSVETGLLVASERLLEGETIYRMASLTADLSTPSTDRFILPDGTVYGVVGVELLCSYLEAQLPLTELQNDGTGAYLLAVTTDEKPVGSIPLQPVTFSTQDRSLKSAQSIVMQDSGAAGTIVVNKTKYFACAEPLTLYDRNAPFSNEHWLLLGIVPNSTLYKISNDMQSLLLVAVVLTLGVGLVCSYLVSRGLAHPIRQLSDEVAAIQDKRTAIPKLSRTGIREIDGFSTAITQLSQDILDTSTKFLRIMDMASIELGGYEIREDSDKVFVTDNFFSMLGMQDANPNDVTRERFEMLMEDLVLQKESFSLQDGGCVFTIPQKDGSERFVMLRITGEDEVQVGLVEDVTAATLERRRIEHERDYDVLTGLYNRRAFDARAKKLFRMPEKLGHAALLMMDMDNLKQINDTFGHDWGDRYINLAGQCFAQTLPQNTICARMSGDEFIVLFYGYDRRDEIRQVLNRLSEAMKERTALLPNGDTMRISISGGIAWYPENGRDLATLKKYADFAMYQVKHESKGEMGEFDIGAYNQEVYAAQLRREFLQMLRENSAGYHFQPIFSAHTGRVEAYEALMRVEMQLLNSPLTVMKLAREMDKLYEVERLTAFKATSTFMMMQNRGRLHRNTKLFLNSIASSSLTDEDVAEFKAQFAELLNNLVIEITEEEEIDREALERKRRAMGDQGALALDDWGSGYSNSNSLLEL